MSTPGLVSFYHSISSCSMAGRRAATECHLKCPSRVSTAGSSPAEQGHHSGIFSSEPRHLLPFTPQPSVEMRSSALLLSLVAAVVATTSAQEATLPRAQRPSPAVPDGVGSFHVKSPRQYAQEQINRPEDETRDITREREQAHRDRTDALPNHRPEPPHLADDPDLFPSSGKCLFTLCDYGIRIGPWIHFQVLARMVECPLPSRQWGLTLNKEAIAPVLRMEVLHLG